MSVTLEEADVRAFIRIISTLFGAQNQGDAAAHAETQGLIRQLQQQVQTMSDKFATELAQLQADVASQGTVIASATTAFQGLAAQLAAAEAAAKAAGATDAQIASVAAVRQGLEQNTAALAAAIPQNTTAAGSEGGGAPAAAAPGTTTSTEGPAAQPDQA